jgi:hypothetical protein
MLKCKFSDIISIKMPYEEVYFQRMEDEKYDKIKSKKNL